MKWINKGTAAGQVTADVTVSALKDKERVSITFRNEVCDVMKKLKYIIIGIDDERLYFKGSTPRYGYKVCTTKTNGYISPKESSLREWVDKYKGDYTVRFDEKMNLYYIDGYEKRKR